MKKIVAAIDGLKYSKSTRDYAINIAKQINAHLVGIFMDDVTYTGYKIYDLIDKEGGTEEKLSRLEAVDKAKRDDAAADFKKTCQDQGLEFSIHHDRKIALHELVHESIYSDLLIIDSKETLTHFEELPPTRFVHELLEETQCPVLLVPSTYKPVQKLVLLYDGRPSSVHAIREFSYLLPQLKHLDTEVISVNPVNTSLHLADNRLIKEFMKRHFPKATYKVMEGWAEEKIVKHLKQISENSLVVLGANRRGIVSRWFRESMADLLMKELNFPLFIAHSM